MGDILRQSLFAHMPIIRDIVYGAAAHGAQPADLCRKLKIELSDLNNSDKRADFETACLSWEYALKVTGNPLLGLHIGQSSTPSILGLVGYLMQNSSTLLEAFKQVCQYGRVATNMFDYGVEERKDEVSLTYAPSPLWLQLYPNGARQAVDQAMAGTLNVFLLLSGKKIRPVNVDFSVKRKNQLEYEETFSAPIHFNSRKNVLVFRREDLLTPVLNHDRSMFKVFEEMVRARRKSPKNFTEQIRSLILSSFHGQVPPAEVLAASMNMTLRSLQRRLADEKTSFRAVSGLIRKEIAKRLLKSTDQKVGEVAQIVGYSAPRSFRRAYKSWTRKTPSQSR